jgi:predicted nuclease of restriction endonuclease-like (RecB) superfamily
MRAFYVAYREILQTVSAKSETLGTSRKLQTLSAISLRAFPLPWSHYVRLLALRNPEARSFYQAEALRGGWTVRQLDRQIGSEFYERTLLSRNKGAMLRGSAVGKPEDAVTPEEEIKDPYVLESFLLELGGDFTFVGRQRRLRVGEEWYRIDLLFFHRRLRCLIIIDLKLGKFTHADAGQMHLYLN